LLKKSFYFFLSQRRPYFIYGFKGVEVTAIPGDELELLFTMVEAYSLTFYTEKKHKNICRNTLIFEIIDSFKTLV
jgi:hypothetical protein